LLRFPFWGFSLFSLTRYKDFFAYVGTALLCSTAPLLKFNQIFQLFQAPSARVLALVDPYSSSRLLFNDPASESVNSSKVGCLYEKYWNPPPLPESSCRSLSLLQPQSPAFFVPVSITGAFLVPPPQQPQNQNNHALGFFPVASARCFLTFLFLCSLTVLRLRRIFLPPFVLSVPSYKLNHLAAQGCVLSYLRQFHFSPFNKALFELLFPPLKRAAGPFLFFVFPSLALTLPEFFFFNSGK